MMDPHDLIVRIYKNDIQRQGRVSHPETPWLTIIEYKEHALGFAQITHIHQPLAAFRFIIGNGCINR